jgi:hypothetical protein
LSAYLYQSVGAAHGQGPASASRRDPFGRGQSVERRTESSLAVRVKYDAQFGHSIWALSEGEAPPSVGSFRWRILLLHVGQPCVGVLLALERIGAVSHVHQIDLEKPPLVQSGGLGYLPQRALDYHRVILADPPVDQAAGRLPPLVRIGLGTDLGNPET